MGLTSNISGSSMTPIRKVHPVPDHHPHHVSCFLQWHTEVVRKGVWMLRSRSPIRHKCKKEMVKVVSLRGHVCWITSMADEQTVIDWRFRFCLCACISMCVVFRVFPIATALPGPHFRHTRVREDGVIQEEDVDRDYMDVPHAPSLITAQIFLWKAGVLNTANGLPALNGPTCQETSRLLNSLQLKLNQHTHFDKFVFFCGVKCMLVD